MRRAALLAVLSCLLIAAPASAEALELFGPDGSITRVDVPVRAAGTVSEREAAALADSPLSVLQAGGPSENRFDLVFVGDGYTAAQQDLFRAHAREKWEAIKGTEPFKEYASLFNVFTVDVVSAESGVDNDPRPPTMRATALDMGFYCQGIERALCVNEAKARAAAEAAPEADQIVVLANSTKYGGVGGAVATSSGASSAASLITVHELGHSLGGLADEYDYYARAGLSEDSTQDATVPLPFLLYPSALGEPQGVNTTAFSTPAAMVAAQRKWWRWVGEPAAEGGTVGTYEGSGYYRFGQFRPTPDSLMHSLGILKGGNAFNAPSAEALVGRFYGKVSPVDAATPEGPVATGATIDLDLVRPATHDLDVVWALDGAELTSARGARSLTVTGAIAAGTELTATVVDPTPLVRDPALRDGPLSRVLRFTV